MLDSAANTSEKRSVQYLYELTVLNSNWLDAVSSTSKTSSGKVRECSHKVISAVMSHQSPTGAL